MCSGTQGWMIVVSRVRVRNLGEGGVRYACTDFVAWRRVVATPDPRSAGHGFARCGACVLVEAVIAKNVIDVKLDFFSQLAPMWIFIIYLVSGLRDRTSEIAFIAAIILATAAILVLYAV